jgi:hypothetical protein
MSRFALSWSNSTVISPASTCRTVAIGSSTITGVSRSLITPIVQLPVS